MVVVESVGVGGRAGAVVLGSDVAWFGEEREKEMFFSLWERLV